MIKKEKIFGFFVLFFCLSIFCSPEAVDFKGTHLSPEFLPYYSPPYQFKGSCLATIIFETSPEVLRALVPKPLIPNPENQMRITIGEQKVIKPLPYNYYEVYFSIPVSFGDKKGRYLPVLYLNKAGAIVSGREIWGYSKLDADIKFAVKDGMVQAVVVRQGIEILKLSLKLGPFIGPIPNSPGGLSYSLKLIPSADKNSPIAIKQLTTAIVKDVAVQKLAFGEAKLVLGGSDSDPLDQIPVKKILKAYYAESDFVLDYGEIVYDYLKSGEK